VRAIVLDIEGTTTPIAFVRDTLFPYARRELRPFLDADAEARIRSLAVDFQREHERDAATSADVTEWKADTLRVLRESIVRYAIWLMDRDRKSTALKALQGRIWENGYTSGELIAPVYDDVPTALRRWREHAVGTGIFSSGSVLAQQLLFRHSSAGDLTPLIQWHFDTSVGAKTDVESYRRIASAIGGSVNEIRFVSDVVAELDSARDAGLQTVLCHRRGEPDPGDHHDHLVVGSFDELD
jgi:enolase-phosphatase E1